MAWQETCVMDERISFIMDVLEGRYTMSECCSHYHISRKTGYKWLARYQQDGMTGLTDRSRAPHHHPMAMDSSVKEKILEIKSTYRHWGARKIHAYLQQHYPGVSHYPAVSTVGLFLRQQGLTHPVKHRARCTPTQTSLTDGQYSNHVWCADFKGHFKTGNGSRCNPLTMSDHLSRYFLCCRHLDKMNEETTQKQFERVFREYGLPEIIRTDNGSPFSSVGRCGLSRLSYWWIRLGIHPERIQPGHPEQNGRLERLHKTLKACTANPPAKSLQGQQRRFNAFRREYNEHRPHEALDMQPPSRCYQHSTRSFPSRLPPIEYPSHMQKRRVQMHGDIIVRNHHVFLTESLYGDYVGLEQVAEDVSLIWYCNYCLGQLDHKSWKIIKLNSIYTSRASTGCIDS